MLEKEDISEVRRVSEGHLRLHEMHVEQDWRV